MKIWGFLFLLVVSTMAAPGCGAGDVQTCDDMRIAFLLGMAGGGRADGLERFFKTEDAAASSWEAIARAYAISRCTEEEMRTGIWRHKVQEILDKALFKRPNGRLNVLEDAFGEGWYQRRDLWDAFLAGAYARFGRDGTFLLHNGAVAYYVSDLLGPWGYDLLIEVNPGFPGVAKVTLKIGEVSDKPIQTFVERMGSLRAALSKGPNPIVAPIRPSVTPRACAPVAPPSGAADR